MADPNIYKAELDLAVAFHKVAVAERDLARAQLRDARADLREAMELLAQVDDGQVPHDTWLDARNALLAKHKETP